MKYAWIADNSGLYAVGTMCRLFKVSRSGYYGWRGRQESHRSYESRELVGKIEEVRAGNKNLRTYGSPRMHEELVGLGYRCSKNRVARLMRKHGIRALQRRRFRITTNSKHNHPVAGNLLERRFNVDAPNRSWVSDVTYVWTGNNKNISPMDYEKSYIMRLESV